MQNQNARNVTVAPDVNNNRTTMERQHLQDFVDDTNNRRDNGQQLTFLVGTVAVRCRHLTYGAGSSTVTVFYQRSGNTYQIIGVGSHDGDVKGKTAYSCLWNGKGNKRVRVIVQ